MELSSREVWALIHGIGLGAIYLLAFTAGWTWLRSYRSDLMTVEGIDVRYRRMVPRVWLLTIVCWLTCFTGMFIVYPWYRAVPPEGANLELFPQAFLQQDADTAAWHSFGMEWKEHVAWLSPILATCVAAVATMYGPALAKNSLLRRSLMLFHLLAFLAATVAGLFGALITKAAGVR
jgi:hypothetical protein